ncbi:hypothetical protein IP93_01371 [Lysobacter ruishenii]|uniref:DUF456 domain-containing protein n=2 Tax=Aerolutibacter ruishenii TaxID=686800 RepID=A0A562LWT0_9GAMM|nr:DUF456 family protein [Lysobacter ruishenii]TWI12090.1 hypothetical protein IP93_01371 [Lysobacter ruishenii]
MDTQTILYLVAALLMLVGLAGTVLPALPGIPLMFVGMVLAAWAGGFEYVGWGWLVALGILTLLSLGIDLLAASMGAKRVGASRLALAGAVLGTLVGIFFGPLGLFAGPFVGALAGELIQRRDLGQATKVGVGTWFGIVLGTVLKVGLAFAMLGLFAFAWWT